MAKVAPVAVTKKTKQEIIEEEDEDDDLDVEDSVEDDEDDGVLDLDLDIEVPEAREFTALPAGTYPAYVMESDKNGSLPRISRATMGYLAGRKQVEFGFKIVGPKGTNRVMYHRIGTTETTQNGQSKLALTLVALLGEAQKRSIKTEDDLNDILEECRNAECYISIKKAQDKKDKEKYWNNVSFVSATNEKHPGVPDDEDDD